MIKLDKVTKRYGETVAVRDLSLEVNDGEVCVLIGPSGCGKTTTLRMVNRLVEPTSGSISVNGKEVLATNPEQLRRSIGYAIQSVGLFPHMTVAANIATVPELLHWDKARVAERVTELLNLVSLKPAEYAGKYPAQLSGGEAQRIGVARALACNPRLIVCDEPISALDVSIQAQIINLLEDLQEQSRDLSYLFIAHDLSVVRHISNRVAVMYLGRIMEVCRSRVLYENPLHPYTRALLSAVPIADPVVEETRERIILKGEVPSPLNPPSGCSFHPRCFMAIPECAEAVPPLRDVGDDHYVACIRV